MTLPRLLTSLTLWAALTSACTSSSQPPGQDAHDPSPAHGDHAGEAGHADEHEGHAGEGAHQEGVVRLTPETLKSSGIQLATPTMGSLERSIRLSAQVELNPDHVAHVNPLVEGQLLSVQARLGDRVEQAQPLASIRSVVLGQARAELSRTRAIYSAAKRTLSRQESLREEGINSERRLLEAQLARDEALAELEAARSRLSVFGSEGGSGPDMTLQSPIKGLVMERHATRGESVTPQDTLFVIADLSTVWVMGRAYAQHIGALSVGMQATVTLDAYPGRSWSGKIDYIASRLDEPTRTLPIRVELENPDELLKPGMFGALMLASQQAASAQLVMVPQQAVLELDKRPVVFVRGEDELEFRAIPVTTGRQSAGQIEILSGLDSRSRVVVQGGFVLKSELMRGELGEGHAH